MESSKGFFRGSPGFSTCLFHKVKVCVAQTVLSAGGFGKVEATETAARLPLGWGHKIPWDGYVFGCTPHPPRTRTPRHQDDMAYIF